MSDQKNQNPSSQHPPIPPNGGSVVILPWSPQWNAWLAFHRGSKTAARMLATLAPGAAPWREASEFPPAARADMVTRRANSVSPVSAVPSERRSIGDGEVAAIAARLEQRAAADDRERSAHRAMRQRQACEDELLKHGLAAVAVGQRPELKNSALYGAIDIDDPYEGRRRRKIVALRDDPVGRMAKRKQISAQQLAAARTWQQWYEAAERGSVRGLDPARGKVDGGKLADGVLIGALEARQRILALDRFLGERGAVLVRRVLGEKFEIAQIAAMDGDTSQRHVDFLARRFRECLDTLVEKIGLRSIAVGAGAGIRADRAHPFGVDERLWNESL